MWNTFCKMDVVKPTIIFMVAWSTDLQTFGCGCYNQFKIWVGLAWPNIKKYYLYLTHSCDQFIKNMTVHDWLHIAYVWQRVSPKLNLLSYNENLYSPTLKLCMVYGDNVSLNKWTHLGMICSCTESDRSIQWYVEYSFS